MKRSTLTRRIAGFVALGHLMAGFTAGIAAQAQIDQPGAGSYIQLDRSSALRCARYAEKDMGRAYMVKECDAALADGTMDRDARAATLMNRSIILRRMGHHDDALRDCLAGLETTDQQAIASVNCAAVMIDAGQADRAITLLEKAPLPAIEHRYKYFHNLALAHHDSGNYRQAYGALQKVLALRPGFGPAEDLIKNYRVVPANQTAHRQD